MNEYLTIRESEEKARRMFAESMLSAAESMLAAERARSKYWRDIACVTLVATGSLLLILLLRLFAI